MPRTDYRCTADLQQYEKLTALSEVKAAIERNEKEREKVSTRHQLLATAVRLARGLAPRIDTVLERCREKLEVATEVETFVFPDPKFNAFCFRPEHGRVMVMLSSALVESFGEGELAFIIGHELGHHVLEHHRVPVQLLLGEVAPPVVLQLYAWQRYAEISADRAGLLCAGDLENAAGALFKLASGLKGGMVNVSARSLLAQVDDMRQELEQLESADALPRSDWFATHPFSPLRLHAAKSFAESEFVTKGGTPRERLEEQVLDLMGIMEPGYLKEKTDAAESMRRLLFAGGVAVAAASDGISDVEIAQLEKFFGEGALPMRLDGQALRRDLPRRVQDVRECVSPLRRSQVLRDLCLVALADGVADEAEQRVLFEIADGLGVERALVLRTLAGVRALD